MNDITPNVPNLDDDITSNVPNLDDDITMDYMRFWARHRDGRHYRALFPAGGRGTKRATADLAAYASNRHAARYCRLRGDIVGAQVYEIICDRIYNRLPTWARW